MNSPDYLSRMTDTLQTLAPAGDSPLAIGGQSFRSRLMVGTGKYRTNAEMVRAIAATGAEIVTVAVRRVDLDRRKEESVLHHLDPDRYFLLANTAGCYSADEAVRYARLAREAGFNEFVKLEVIGDQETLLPDTHGLLEAAAELVHDGFTVLAYTNDDLITALRLEDAGCAAVMPLASPIGSGLGLLNPMSIRTIKQRLSVPVIVDAGVGTASDACVTMEQGVDGILMNTALAEATDPVLMAKAMRLAVEAGRAAFLAGRMPRREIAVPSSPVQRDAGVGYWLIGYLLQRTSRAPGRAHESSPTFARGGHSTPRSIGPSPVSPRPTAGWLTRSRPASSGNRARSTAASAPLVPRGWESVAPELRDVLRLGAFQLTSLDRVPAHAAVDTSVSLARPSAAHARAVS